MEYSTKIIAIDYGTKRIGLAVSDTSRSIVFGRGVVSSIKKIKNLCRKEKIKEAVLGLPLFLDGTENSQTKKVRKFKERLEKTGLKVYLVDERLTSRESFKKMKGYKKEKLDKNELSAMIILETYLGKL